MNIKLVLKLVGRILLIEAAASSSRTRPTSFRTSFMFISRPLQV